MGLLGAASDKVQYELAPVGEYVFTLWDLTLENGQWGDQIKWVWLISPVNDPDAYFMRGEGANAKEKELWQFTKIGLPKGSRAREWSEALIGRELRLGEEPDDTDLVRRRMIAYLVHKPKKSDPTIKQEAISEGSSRAFLATPPASQGVSANASQAEIDAELKASDELRAKCRKAIRNATLDEIPGSDDWAAIELSTLSDDQVRELYEAVRGALLAAA